MDDSHWGKPKFTFKIKIMNIKSIVVGALALLGFASFSFAEAELDGYCPVCYVAAGKAVKGTEEFKADHDGKTYYFVKEEAKAAFEKEPEKFLPAYDGYCSYGISLGKKFKADPTQFTVVDGVIYLNSSEDIKKKFDDDKAGFIKAANEKWETVSKESK